MRVGIDLDTWKLTLCAIDAPEPSVVLFAQESLRKRGQSLFDAVQGIPFALSQAFAQLDVHVNQVYIERGRGMFRTADFELGAIWGATALAVRRQYPDVFVESVTVSEWKKLVTAHTGVVTKTGVPGNGNAPKALANESCVTLLGRLGIIDPGLTPDHLDAFGIVWSAGRELPERAARPDSRAKPTSKAAS